MPQLRPRPVTFVAALALMLGTAAAAQADSSAPTTQVIPPPSTTAPPTTAPPTTGFLGLFPPPTEPSTTAPSTTKAPGKTGPSTAAPGPPGPTPGDAVPPPGTPKVIPPDAQRQIDSVRRTGSNNTTAWLAGLQPLVTEFGMNPTDAAIAGGVHFPIAGPTTWSDDWLFPRYVPTFHLHQGVDLFATMGTPVRAPFDGVLRFSDSAVGGMAAYLTLPDGTFYYMAHLAGFAPGKVTGQQVRQGEVLGFVGDSGDAKGGAPHCHFEFHPKGGPAVAPKPSVDAWLAEATANAPQLIAATRAARNPAGPAASASVTALPDGSVTPPPDTSRPVDPAAALWAASSNPAIGTIDLASSLVASVADDIDWSQATG